MSLAPFLPFCLSACAPLFLSDVRVARRKHILFVFDEVQKLFKKYKEDFPAPFNLVLFDPTTLVR